MPDISDPSHSDSVHSVFSPLEVVRDLHAQFPDTPFLTLGQTVLWDEPVKAAFCRMLEVAAPEARMMAAVHDTDYFAKLPQDYQHETQSQFVMLPHNDGSTRSLWSAAGEISCLFGSETVPTRHALTENGVAFDRVAKNYPNGLDALLENETEAWGWRALVHTEARPLIAGDVKIAEIAPILREQIAWALNESAQIVGRNDANQKYFEQLLDWTNEYSLSHPDATLSNLYQYLTPKLWSAIRGGGSCNLETSSSLELFRFNTQTCDLPRFGFLDLFLNPKTRELARRCYDDAVRGSGIYTLSQFGEGATPFDVVVPGRGRGTLRVHDGSIFIETETPITLCTDCNPTSVRDMARVLEAQLGADVAIVGKAVALISMLAAEFVFVFHEKASSYTTRTQQMNDCLREAGIELKLHPMLRLKYATWNALHNVEATFHLPPHLARAFGDETISARDFSASWETVCAQQDALRAQLKACAAPRDLMQFLSIQNDSARWSDALHEYSLSRAALHEAREQSQKVQAENEGLQTRARSLNDQATQLETAQGEHWRREIQPLRARLMDIRQASAQQIENAPLKTSKDERREMAAQNTRDESEIESLRAQIENLMTARHEYSLQVEELRGAARECKSASRRLTQQRVHIEHNEATKAARDLIRRLEYEAELERLQRVRDAIAVSDGLRYTNLRPTAWWFPLVSPDGKWFESLVETAQARVEKL